MIAAGFAYRWRHRACRGRYQRRLRGQSLRVRARADTHAEVHYNDFNLEKPAKRAGVIKLVQDFRARALRIDGVGNQAHWRLDTPSIDEIETALADLHATLLKVLYTELVTFWGLSDADSWLNRGRMNYSLLWDRQRQPKPAFTAVVDALRSTK